MNIEPSVICFGLALIAVGAALVLVAYLGRLATPHAVDRTLRGRGPGFGQKR